MIRTAPVILNHVTRSSVMSQVSPYIDRFALVVLRFVLELEN